VGQKLKVCSRVTAGLTARPATRAAMQARIIGIEFRLRPNAPPEGWLTSRTRIGRARPGNIRARKPDRPLSAPKPKACPMAIMSMWCQCVAAGTVMPLSASQRAITAPGSIAL